MKNKEEFRDLTDSFKETVGAKDAFFPTIKRDAEFVLSKCDDTLEKVEEFYESHPSDEPLEQSVVDLVEEIRHHSLMIRGLLQKRIVEVLEDARGNK